MIRARAPAAPIWLHEGLAQIAEGKQADAAEARLAAGATPDASDLGKQVLAQSDPALVGRFYDMTLAFTRDLQEARGDAGILTLLERLGRGETVDDALREVYGESLSPLFDRWRARKLPPR
jgi:hypothetical protein